VPFWHIDLGGRRRFFWGRRYSLLDVPLRLGVMGTDADRGEGNKWAGKWLPCYDGTLISEQNCSSRDSRPPHLFPAMFYQLRYPRRFLDSIRIELYRWSSCLEVAYGSSDGRHTRSTFHHVLPSLVAPLAGREGSSGRSIE
jgi:hypothetical protein